MASLLTWWHKVKWPTIQNRKKGVPIQPPPGKFYLIESFVTSSNRKSLQCPFYFMVANLMSADSGELLSTQDYLAGSTISSLYRLRDIDDTGNQLYHHISISDLTPNYSGQMAGSLYLAIFIVKSKGIIGFNSACSKCSSRYTPDGSI